MRLLEAEGKARLLEAKKEVKMYEREEAEKNRISGLKKSRIEVNLPHGLRRGEGFKENTVES